MSGKYGVSAIKQLVTVVKLGAISVLQNVQKDGFQASDLFAPLESGTFKAELEKAKDQIKNVLPELAELDAGDFWDLGVFAIAVYKDVKTELAPAMVTLKKLKQVA